MARDRAKNAYYTVGVPLDSDTLSALRADSEETGVSISQLLAVRVADWYRFTREMKSAAPLHADPIPENGKALAGIYDPKDANGDGLQTRASAAAAAWGGGEEE